MSRGRRAGVASECAEGIPTVAPTREKTAVSLLVRAWQEPRERSESSGQLRVYVRNLRSGAEQYAADPDEITDLLVSELAAALERLPSSKVNERANNTQAEGGQENVS